ncbi:hypothetical protein H112_08138 [Trichophyton rubrum D6]|uniref:BRCT domain-containing protein n=1 Tax=Trichophyton rubrum CBS 288.86 TaxID=1215330 RepID=A0A022VQ08_TRIRU|nr:hypothetical protein H100_08165 [Trichophyton rubrum MR850]EZF37500.1 hypothetical protein H102_08121 [Trichophyton rubrum CBS 100081]EZF48135.1 hypothetical protein H103_08149 [Trichophyton rubrum CBS 288.86]EZF58790.1 hypothetical protein H104_08097 [Trichophyton rubrum CBS 289.86]EZF80064.1 hypothetical protein H110_08151 [Trichophyton rubrum MR1448]EZG12271.1 hypothetical protein H107_08289 [Trichophyton rubrum CBS 202.88]KDB29247.1 hypothetical protein H112_08138 [Trichophyton rubrum 
MQYAQQGYQNNPLPTPDTHHAIRRRTRNIRRLELRLNRPPTCRKEAIQFLRLDPAIHSEWAWLDKQGRKKLGRLNAGNGDIRRFMSTGKRRAGDEVSGKSEVTKRLKLMQGEQHEHNHEHGQVAGDDLPVMSLEQSKGAVCFDERYDRTSMNYKSYEVNDTHADKDKRIFANLTIYINGSTMPLISDHKLKNMLVDHGAKISIGLARRSVTHVILGDPNGAGEVESGGAGKAARNSQPGAGGGLAAGKMQREISRVSGMGVKFVGVEWRGTREYQGRLQVARSEVR